jgi:hypothetical protein
MALQLGTFMKSCLAHGQWHLGLTSQRHIVKVCEHVRLCQEPEGIFFIVVRIAARIVAHNPGQL